MGTSDSGQTCFFEGAEKLLEIWFQIPDNFHLQQCSLRLIPREELNNLLDIAKCVAISCFSNDYMDTYVLSESSMFITDDRFIIKTCGTTALLHCVEPLLGLARDYCGFTAIKNVFYSRKNFQCPELQPFPHQNFEDEVALLDKLFKNGAGYCFGRTKKDRWYMYTLNPAPYGFDSPDQTLEILMQNLDHDVMSIFTKESCQNGQEATKLSGIDKLFPAGTVIDSFLFNPRGYSMNAVIEGDKYATIHITPQKFCSYVSFETNMDKCCYLEIIQKVLNCFKPGKFNVNVCATEASVEACHSQKQLWEGYKFAGFSRNDCQVLQLPNHLLLYAHFGCSN